MKKLTMVSGAVLAVAALVATAGTALASIPDSGGVIHGCYVIKGGALSVIDTSVVLSCPRGETALNWNQARRDPRATPVPPDRKARPARTATRC